MSKMDTSLWPEGGRKHVGDEIRVLERPETTAPTSPELAVAGDPFQRRRCLSSSPTPPVASTGAL